MNDPDRLPDAAPNPKDVPKENSGEYLWRVLKPAGAVFVLLLFIVFLVFCFTYRGDPAEPVAETTEPTVTTVINK